MKKIQTLIVLLLFFVFALFTGVSAQNTATVFGSITEGGSNQPIEFAIVVIKETNKTVETNAAGEYALKVPTGRNLTLRVSRVGYKEATFNLAPLQSDAQRRIDFSLVSSTSQQEVVIKADRMKDNGMVREDVKDFRLLPTTTGNLESLLPALALGTNMGSGGELTSQYQVRGGNYDENLVYVNDFEIYRPQLIRAGQQEGLTFANPDLMRDLTFSSGGFEARYGDKMSSVLDIKYKRPDSLRSSVSMSALGATAHLEGSRKLGTDGYRRFRYLIGARYKTNSYLLSSLETKGEYNPNFGDIQAYLTYDVSRSWQLAFLGNYNTSVFNFVPQSRASAFGLINFTLGISTVFEGKEQDKFVNGMTGVSLTYLPDRKKNPLFLKFLASRFQTRESEGIDIVGSYILGEVESNPNAQNAGQIKDVLGEGQQHQYVRNVFWGGVTNIEHRGGYEMQLNSTPSVLKTNFLQWGVKFQNEQVEDRINEWERLDSALYSLPFDTTKLAVRTTYKTQNSLNSNRLTGFLQNTFTWRKDSVGELQATLGVRAQYWDLNKEAFVTPRLQLAYKPSNWRRDFSFRLAGGLYYQPAFYRELRRPDGTINVKGLNAENEGLFAQKSAQVTAGLTYDFAIGNLRRIPFRVISEVYYKSLWDIVTYDLDNVRVRYSGENDATGYIMGWDTRINGEFVPGAESWVNFSLLRARESITGVTHKRRNPGEREGVAVADVPRPTDRLFNLSVFFQDYLPKNKNFKMHSMITVGSGLPFGFPTNNIVYRNTYRFKPYHRVDLGFSFMLWDEARKARRPNHFLRFTRQTWASLEVFNLMAVANEASKTWLKTIYNTQFPIPNYLTSRRVNLRMRMDF
jgi:CarboxypepD_reg-like domain/TonB-dependent Receptor Plug Domain